MLERYNFQKVRHCTTDVPTWLSINFFFFLQKMPQLVPKYWKHRAKWKLDKCTTLRVRSCTTSWGKKWPLRWYGKQLSGGTVSNFHFASGCCKNDVKVLVCLGPHLTLNLSWFSFFFVPCFPQFCSFILVLFCLCFLLFGFCILVFVLISSVLLFVRHCFDFGFLLFSFCCLGWVSRSALSLWTKHGFPCKSSVFWCHVASKVVVQFCFGFSYFVVFWGSCFSKLACSICCLLSRKHNRRFAYLDLVLLFVVHFLFSICWCFCFFLL